MSNEGWTFWKWVACGVVGIALAASAAAAPPLKGALFPRSGGDSNPGRLSGFRPSADRPTLARLDLRAPDDLPASTAAARPHGPVADADPAAEAFPALHRSVGDSTRAKLEQDLPSLGSDGMAVRPASRAEEMARRFRHEGLPVARLFETRSALVSLGLNQRGKPGIWLIQKIR